MFTIIIQFKVSEDEKKQLTPQLKSVRDAGVISMQEISRELDVYVKVPFTEAVDLVGQ